MNIHWKGKWSLQSQTLILIIFFSLSILAIAEWFSNRSAERAIDIGIARQASNVAERLAHSIEVISSDELSLQNQIQEILELEPNIARVDIYEDLNGKLDLFQSSSKRGERSLVDLEKAAFYADKANTFTIDYQGKNEFFSTYPLRFKNGRKGFVTVISHTKSIHEILASRLWVRLFSVLGTAIFLVAAIVLIYRTTIYRGVQHLVNVMHRYKRGEIQARADESLPGEFGELAVNFNDLLGQLQGFNDHLKQQVSQATQELTRQNQDLQQLNLQILRDKSRLNQAERLALAGQMTATFAHEIGSPLSAIATHLQILLEDSQLEPHIRDRLQLAYDQIERVCSIVETLLKTTRHSTPRVSVELEETVKKVIRLLSPTLEVRHVNIELSCPTGPLLVEGDSDQLQQLFLNLLNNSLDAISDGGMLSIKISRLSDAQPTSRHYFRIEVSDSGVGIANERLEHIFEPFYTTKGWDGGTGLGLAVSKEIVKQHGGQISVVSVPGQGTCFTILLPEYQGSNASHKNFLKAKEAKV